MSTKPPSGTRDFLPADVRRREYVIGIVRSVYEKYGFEPLETPAFENIDTLLGKYGDEGNKLIFKILKRGEHEQTGEADLALRYDLTVPLARVVAQYQNELPKFFKRYQIQPVWRADRPARGRFREFYQCDVDSIGSTSPIVDAEIVNAVSEALVTLGFRDFVVRLNHRVALAQLLDVAGVPRDSHATALVAIDKLDKIGADGVEKELVSRGMTEAVASKCLKLFEPPVSERAADTLERLDRQLGSGSDAVTNLREVLAAIGDGPALSRIRIDPSLARGLSYYTGAIMEINVSDLAGSLAGGGRYDNLIGMFLGRDIPACGCTLGLERIIVVMTERNMFPPRVASGVIDVMVTTWNEPALQAAAMGLARSLREGGLRVDVYPEPDKLGKQFKYASDRHVPFVVVQGSNEQATGTINIKDLRTGDQQSVARAEAAAFVKSRLNG